MTALAAVLAGVLGTGAGVVAHRAAAAFPWARAAVVVPVGGEATIVPPPRGLGRGVTAALTAALFAVLTLRFGTTALLPAWLAFGAAGVLLAAIDLRHKLLPNRVVLPTTVAVLALLTLAAAVEGNGTALLRAVLGGAVAVAVGFGMAVLAPSGLGLGDVKLAGLLGLLLGWLGWPVLVLGFLLGFVGQALVGLVLLVTRRAGRRTELPFGPALLAGAVVAALLGGPWAGL